ncbi:MAG: hypothetical protein AMS25_01405 [Gemmatimonas sp. SM23_52]|nr:MAG: hypothetical protein AMS25_01405 [Gemmatimonas sp. SM23_52]
MRHRLCLAALTLFCVATVGDAGSAQTEPYAPKAGPPEQMGNDPLLQMEIRSLQAAQVPALTEVQAPPYPGAVVVATAPPRSVRVRGGRTVETLPVIILFSADEPQQVVEFYEENLSGWSRAELLAGDYFWVGSEQFDPLHLSGQIIPSVHIRQARTSKLVPEARTEIHVRYAPSTAPR